VAPYTAFRHAATPPAVLNHEDDMRKRKYTRYLQLLDDDMLAFDGDMELDEAAEGGPYARPLDLNEARARALVTAWMADMRKAVKQ
jgi:hypothetical protein